MTKVKQGASVDIAAPATTDGPSAPGPPHPSPVEAGPAGMLSVDVRGLRDAREAGAPSPVIEVRGLRMTYGPVEAVSGIDLEVDPGRCSPSSARTGRARRRPSRSWRGSVSRSGGEVSVLGEDPARAGGEWRARIGVVLQESEPEPELTVEECMALYAGYYPRSRPVGETLDLVGLADRPTDEVRSASPAASAGRLDVALALIGDPELLFLDEPTTGFDPSARRAAWEVISGLRDLGKTIFLTTHYMEEAEYLADRIAVIAKGQIVAEGTAASIGGRATRASTIRFTLPPGLSAADLPPTVTSALIAAQDGQVEAKAASPLPLVGDLAAWAGAAPRRPS